MDVQNQLEAYVAQLVALGGAALARHRRGEWLPDDLVALAEPLLALEGQLAVVTTAAAAPDAADDAFVEQMPAEAAPPEPATLEAAADDAAPDAAAPDETVVETPAPEAPPDMAAMSPVEADDWLTALDDAGDQQDDFSSGMSLIPNNDNAAVAEPLVIDVPEEADSGPAWLSASVEPASPLVVGSTDILSDWPSPAAAVPPAAVPDETPAAAAPPAAAPDETPATPAGELRFCTNCGNALRPGRRFCHVCGASVADMMAELPATPAPPAPLSAPPAPEAAPQQPPRPNAPREEWPTVVHVGDVPPQSADSVWNLGDVPRYETPGAPAYHAPIYDDAPLPRPIAPAMARFCNNCGLGLDPGVTVCPDCGSRDIS